MTVGFKMVANVPWLYEVAVSRSRNFTNIPKRMKEKREFLCKKCKHKLFQKIPSPAIS
jgi:hypothetical protein